MPTFALVAFSKSAYDKTGSDRGRHYLLPAKVSFDSVQDPAQAALFGRRGGSELHLKLNIAMVGPWTGGSTTEREKTPFLHPKSHGYHTYFNRHPKTISTLSCRFHT